MTTGWASFGLHPVLMTLAFGLFMPLSALSYRGLERLLGVSHAAAKATHGTLMLVAVILGVLGFIDMWIVHQNGKGSGFHFISVHSWVGILVLVAAALQYLSGLSIFYLPASPPSLRKAWLPAHVALGSLWGVHQVRERGRRGRSGHRSGRSPPAFGARTQKQRRDQVEREEMGARCSDTHTQY